jgi:hypothetical protein
MALERKTTKKKEHKTLHGNQQASTMCQSPNGQWALPHGPV